MSSEEEEDDDLEQHYIFKLLVVGQPAVGKTCTIWRYVNDTFTMHYKITIGVDFALKVVKWAGDKIVRLQFWDLSGQERFNSMSRVYYKEAVGAFVVFDVTQPSTLESAIVWKKDIDEKCFVGPPENRVNIPVLLLANKVDLCEGYEEKNKRVLDQFCQEYGFIGWVATSAKLGTNIDQGVRRLLEEIFRTNTSLVTEERPDDVIQLKAEPEMNRQTSSSTGGCCGK